MFTYRTDYNGLANAENAQKVERLSRQTSLVALEVAMEAAENGLSSPKYGDFALTARDIACHVTKATVEMQHATSVLVD